MLLIELNDPHTQSGKSSVEWKVGEGIPKLPPCCSVMHVFRIQADGDEAMHVYDCFEIPSEVFTTIPWNSKSKIQVWYGDTSKTIYECLGN